MMFYVAKAAKLWKDEGCNVAFDEHLISKWNSERFNSYILSYTETICIGSHQYQL